MSDPASSFQLPASGRTLGIITSQFPELHETFVARELTALREAGIPLRIYSLKRCRDRIIHPEARALLDVTTYVAWDDPRVWLAGLWQGVCHPRRAWATKAWVLRHHGWPLTTLGKALVVWAQAAALARRMARDGVTHVHAHWATMPTTAAVLISQWAGIPFSFTAHAWDVFVDNPSLDEKVRLAACVITCTEHNRRHLAQRVPDARAKIVLNYHGVDVEQFARSRVSALSRSDTNDANAPTRQRANAHTSLFLSVGRLVATKGFDTLLEAYRLLRQKRQDFHAVIVGQGPRRAALERRIRALSLSDCVELRAAMPRETLRALYAQAAAFVLPSVVTPDGDRDGIPNVILEAMAMGLPVVSTTVSGIPEAVQDRRTGLLVPPGDPQALVHALEVFLRRPQTARMMGDQGRMWAETQFGAREHMQRLVGQMQDLLLGHGTGDMGQANARTSHVPRPMSRDPNDVATLQGSHVPRPTSHVPTRVLYVIWSLGLGGAEQVVIRLAAGLDRSRFTPIICCVNEPGPFASLARNTGIEVVALHKRGPADLRVIPRLVRLMRARRIGVVHTHLWGANTWGRIAARLARVPVVVATEHNVDVWKRPVHFAIDRFLARRTTVLVAVSHQVREFYEAAGVGRGRWQVVYNGIDAAAAPPRGRGTAYRALGIPNGEPVVGLIGRLVPAKAPLVFLDAIEVVQQQIPSLKALIIGDGPLRGAVEARVKQRGLKGCVQLTGVRDDVPQLLAGMDALLCSSEREGLSMAMLEAMAAGVPVVATRVGGTPELIESGVSGVLVSPRDPYALAQQLVKLLTDASHADAIRHAARARVTEQFSLRQMVEAHEYLYAKGQGAGDKGQGAEGLGHGTWVVGRASNI